MGTCPICLDEIIATQIDQQSGESFLDECFHHFHFKCILEWTNTQLKNEVTPLCPLCKRPYQFIIHDDCPADGSFSRHFVYPDHRGKSTTDDASFKLTPEQRRRRSVYFLPLDQQTGIDTGIALNTYMVQRPELVGFIRRELQAVLLERDVDIILQHVIGIIQHSITGTTTSRPDGRGMDVNKSVQDTVEAVSLAMQPYALDFAEQFAVEVVAFMQAKLSIKAYDDIVFHIEPDGLNES